MDRLVVRRWFRREHAKRIRLWCSARSSSYLTPSASNPPGGAAGLGKLSGPASSAGNVGLRPARQVLPCGASTLDELMFRRRARTVLCCSPQRVPKEINQGHPRSDEDRSRMTGTLAPHRGKYVADAVGPAFRSGRVGGVVSAAPPGVRSARLSPYDAGQSNVAAMQSLVIFGKFLHLGCPPSAV